jgi:hypothetical protein
VDFFLSRSLTLTQLLIRIVYNVSRTEVTKYGDLGFGAVIGQAVYSTAESLTGVHSYTRGVRQSFASQ